MVSIGLGLFIVLTIVALSGSIITANADRGREYFNFNDNKEPSIVAYYYKPTLPKAGNEITVYARVLDDVAVNKATLFYDTDGEPKKTRSIEMSSYNTEWFVATIPGNDVKASGLKYWIGAEDRGGNIVTNNAEKIPVEASPIKTQFSITPSATLRSVKVVTTKNGDGFSASIAISNLGQDKVGSLRIMLSPELGRMFRLSDYAIGSVDANGTQNIDLKLVGNPPLDVMGDFMGYKGQIIIMAEHLSPIKLDVSAAPAKSLSSSAYMNSIAVKAEQRYNRAPLDLGLLKSSLFKPKPSYEITSGDAKAIENPASALTIKNVSDQPLKNVRIYISSLGKQFLLADKNILFIDPKGQISIPLISKIETDSGSTRPYSGEVLIVPEYGVPITFPINIAPRPAKTDPFEVSTMHAKDGIYTASEKIIIKNNGGRSLDSAAIKLSDNLAKFFVLSEDAFKKIEPGEERTIEIKLKGGIPAMTNNISGDLIVVSEHHDAKTIPINLTWKKVTGQHFTVYARDNTNDLSRAENLVAFLDGNYKKVAERVGETKTASTIYILDTQDEMKDVVGTDAMSLYDYNNDLIVLCGCTEDLFFNALYEHTYRAIIINDPSYWNREKILFDRGNWLVDGLARYTVARTLGEDGAVKKEVAAYNANPVELEWYGSGAQSHHGASYTFVKYLSKTYGERVISETLRYLGAGQISNHRCDTLENCSVLQAVYKVNGLDRSDKRYSLNFDFIVQGWLEYTTELTK